LKDWIFCQFCFAFSMKSIMSKLILLHLPSHYLTLQISKHVLQVSSQLTFSGVLSHKYTHYYINPLLKHTLILSHFQKE
jgi:hypothetical protein